VVNNIPPPKLPPIGGPTPQPGLNKMPPPEVQQAINLASMVTHANGLIATLALEEIMALRQELGLAAIDLRERAADLEVLPPEFEAQAHPAMVAFEKQARNIAATKLRGLAQATDPAN